MSIYSRNPRKIGIWLLLLAFVFVAIVLPLLSIDAPDSATAVTFALIFILEVLFAFFLIRCNWSAPHITPEFALAVRQSAELYAPVCIPDFKLE